MADDVLTRVSRHLATVQRAWSGQADATADGEKLSGLEVFVRFWGMTVRSFARNRVPVRAAALAYSSLLAMVPMLALVLTIALGFLQGDEGKKYIEDFTQQIVEAVVPQAEGTEAAQQETVKNLTDFVTRQQTSAVSASAALMLVFIAIMMLSRIEDTFNDIWGVERGRGWFARVTQYWATLTLGPVLLLVVIGVTSTMQLQSVHEKLATMPLIVGAMAEIVFQCLPFVLLSLGFAGFYVLLPATKVHWKAALVGGIVGGCLWQLNNLLSVLYVSRVVANNKVYGSLGMVPVVMIGLYFSWMILLFGAQVAYSFQNRRAYFQERQVESLDQHSREFIGLRIMVEIGRRFIVGEKPATGAALSELLGVPTGLTGKILQAYVSARLLAESQQGETAYLPARPLEKITCHDVLHALRSNANGSLSTRQDATREQVRGHYERFQSAQKTVSADVTLAALAADAAGSPKATE